MNRKQRRAAQRTGRSGWQAGGDPRLAAALAVAVEHLQAGRLPEARTAHERILAVDPRHAASLHHLGLIEHKSGNSETAAALIRRCLAIRPDHPDALVNLSVVLGELGKFDEALAAGEKAITLAPRHARAHSSLGNLLKRKGR